MRFSKKETDIVIDITAPITLLGRDDEITNELLKPNYENQESPWVFSLGEEDETKISDVVQAKVNIKGLGYFLAAFNIESFSKETRKELFDKLITLKEIDVSESNEKLVEKISKALGFINEYKPYYVVFNIEGMTDQAECVIYSIKVLECPLLYVKKAPIEDIDLENSPEKDIFEHYLVSNYSEDKVKRVHEILDAEAGTPSNQPTTFGAKVTEFFKGFERPFKSMIKYRIEHLFNALYSMLIAVCALLGAIYFDNKSSGIGVLFIVFVVLFFTLIVYNLYLYGKENKDAKIQDYILYGLISIVFIILGVIFGWLLCKSLVKFENPINFKKNILVAAIISPIVVAIAHAVRFLFDYLLNKLKNKATKEM